MIKYIPRRSYAALVMYGLVIGVAIITALVVYHLKVSAYPYNKQCSFSYLSNGYFCQEVQPNE